MALNLNNIDEKKPSVLSVAEEYVRKPNGVQNLIVDPTLKVLKWADWWQEGLSVSGKQGKALLGKFSHGLNWLDIPRRIQKIHKAVFRLRKHFINGAVRELPVATNKVFIETGLAAGLIADTLEICRQDKLISLNTSQLIFFNAIGFLGSIALFLKAASGLKKQIGKVKTLEIASTEFKLSLLRIIGKICLMAIGAFGAMTFLLGVIIPQFLFLSISTILLITTIAAHFYEKLYIEKKKKSVEV